MSEKNVHIPCAFVNGLVKSVGPPLGFKVESHRKDGVGTEKLSLVVFRRYHYEHPEAPMDAILTVLQEEPVFSCYEGSVNYPKLKMLQMAQDVVSKISVG